MQQSALVYKRFRERRGSRRVVAVLLAVLSIVYLVWRVTIINWDSLSLSLIYLTAEVLGFVLCLNVIFSSWSYRHREPQPILPGRTVDIFVTAYKEPEHILRKTLRAAVAARYPHQTWLLDDGRRPELAALAEELGVRYVTRPDNRGSKAGNLNNALGLSTAEFVFVLDADHIPLPNAIEALIGFFAEPSVAMVQAPQVYYNTDAFQYRRSRTGRLWHDQTFFYSIAQGCRDAFNGASCVGTSVMYRRSALEAIGGIPAATVTEDIHTSLKLHKAGFETVYLNETVAYGVAAADIDEYYKTRHRWAHGNLHALALERVPFTGQLTFGQNLSYFSLGLIYLEGWQQLMLFLVPMASLVLGLPPFEISIFNVLVVMVFPVIVHLLMQELGCGLSPYWANEVFSMARFPVHIVATLGLLGKQMPWRTSSKATKGRFSVYLLAPQITVSLASLAAVAYGVVRLSADMKTGPLIAAGANALTVMSGGTPKEAISWFGAMPEGYTADLVAVAGFWALVNATRALFVVAKAARCAWRSNGYFRFDIQAAAFVTTELAPQGATIRRLSEDWIEIGPIAASVAADELRPGNTVAATLSLRDCRIEARLRLLTVKRRRDADRVLTAQLLPLHRADADRLNDLLYSCNLSPQSSPGVPYFPTVFDQVRRILAAPARWRSRGEAGQHRIGSDYAGSHPEPVLLSARASRKQVEHRTGA